MGQTQPKLQLVQLVSESDQPLGTTDVITAHRGAGMLHRAVSVFLFRRNAASNTLELLMQQRSAQKLVGALQWANTVCGNALPDESYQAAALRRLHDELNITTATLSPICTFRYQVKCNAEYSENELDQVFAGWFTGAVQPNPAEVVQTKWIPCSEAGTITVELDCAPWFTLMQRDEVVGAALHAFISEGEYYAAK